MHQPIELSEYSTAKAVALTPIEVDAIRTAAEGKIAIQPTPGEPGNYDITTTSWIGQVQTESVNLLVKPKVPVSSVMFLVSYALDPIHWQHHLRPEFEATAGIVEAVVPAFVAHTETALARGMLQGYRTEDDSLLTVRGRIRIEDQIRRRFGVAVPIEVRFDEYTEDIEINRVLKAAIRRLGQSRLRNARSMADLRSLESRFINVSTVEYGTHLPEIPWTRLNERHRPAIELAKLILTNTTPELDFGNRRSSAFLVNMNEVFERFVWTALREALELPERAFPRNAKGKKVYLDAAGRVKLEPDLSWWVGGECVFIGDVKYKSLSSTGFKHGDVYQMLAYTTAVGLDRGLIIYAKGEAEEIHHRIPLASKQIDVKTLDLNASPAAILAQVGGIATGIRGSHHDIQLADS